MGQDQEQELDLNLQYSHILRSNGIEDEILEVQLNKASHLKGSHVASAIQFVTVSFKEERRAPLELFVKKTVRTGNEETDRGFKETAIKEGSILTKVFGAMKTFCEANGAAHLIDGLFPKVYHFDEDMILMENLATQNYVMLSKQDKIDFSHAKLVLENLARWQGVTYCMISKAGSRAAFSDAFPYFVENYEDPEKGSHLKNMFTTFMADLIEIVRKDPSSGMGDLADVLSKHQESCFSEMLNAITSKGIFPVVNHGDVWTSNLMFSNSSENGSDESHDKLVFVDLQFARLGSPSLDLSYFLFTSLRREVRKEWRRLLQIYFESFEKTVLSLGHTFNYHLEDFLDDFKQNSKLGLYFGLIVLIGHQVMDAHETTEDAGAGADFMGNFIVSMKDWIKTNPDKHSKLCLDAQGIIEDYLLFGEL